jgi:NADPH:quinone reductase-like Zn-dependent oxidoreductase
VAGGFNAGAQTGYGVIKSLRVRRGDTMLVNGAAGGLGTVVTQLAQLHGARVIGTASSSNHDYLKSLGAEPVEYGDGLVERVRELAPEGVDVALDAGGGSGLEASLELVPDRSRIGTTVAFDRIEELGIADLRNKRSAEQLSELVDLWAQDKLSIHVSELIPLRRAAEAHRISEARHLTGKIVLAVS